MGKDKLKRFTELKSFSNFYQNLDFKKPSLVNFKGDFIDLKGKWKKSHFNNDHPLTLELACGKGEYTFNLAKRHTNRNFIGIDIKGARIHKGAKDALKENLENAAYLRTKIELLEEFFERGEVQEIWIVFWVPRLKSWVLGKALNCWKLFREFTLHIALEHGASPPAPLQ